MTEPEAPDDGATPPVKWVKGMASPNPKGRRPVPKTVKNVRALAKEQTAAMIEVLSRVALNPKSPPAARVAAASSLIDRGWGRAPSGDLEGAEGLIIKVVKFNNQQIDEPEFKVIEHDDGQIMAELVLPHKWSPRPYQRKLWNYLEGGGKRAIEIAHRRWGKDDLALHFAAVSAMQRPATIWHMLPEAAQARKAIWTAVNPHTGKRRIDEAFPLAIRSATLENEMFIRFKNGSTWAVIGRTITTALSAVLLQASSFRNGLAPFLHHGPTSRRSSLKTAVGVIHHNAARK